MNKKQLLIAIIILAAGILIFAYFILYQGQQENALNYSGLQQINAEN